MVEFQSTLPRGERHDVAVDNVIKRQFQSTLPRGERQHIYNSLKTNHLLTTFCDPITKQFKKYSIVKELFYNSPAYINFYLLRILHEKHVNLRFADAF